MAPKIIIPWLEL